MLGWQIHCHMNPGTQPAPSSLTSDLPMKEGRGFAGIVPAVQHTQGHPGTGVRAPAQISTHPPSCSIPPAHCSIGWVCSVEPPSFQRPTGPLRWEIWDLETREQAQLPLTAPCPQGTGPCFLWPVLPQQLLRCAGDNTISSKLVNAFPASRSTGCRGHLPAMITTVLSDPEVLGALGDNAAMLVPLTWELGRAWGARFLPQQ